MIKLIDRGIDRGFKIMFIFSTYRYTGILTDVLLVFRILFDETWMNVNDRNTMFLNIVSLINNVMVIISYICVSIIKDNLKPSKHYVDQPIVIERIGHASTEIQLSMVAIGYPCLMFSVSIVQMTFDALVWFLVVCFVWIILYQTDSLLISPFIYRLGFRVYKISYTDKSITTDSVKLFTGYLIAKSDVELRSIKNEPLCRRIDRMLFIYWGHSG